MSRITKYSKKIRLAYISAAVISCSVLALAFPWFKEVNTVDEGYYVVEYNGQVLGAVASQADAEKAYLQARLQLQSESDAEVFLDDEFKITEKKKIFGSKETTEAIQGKIYDIMSADILDVTKEVYVVDIDGLTIKLETLEEVEALLNASKDKYDVDSKFHAELSSTNDRYDTFTYKLVMAETDIQGAPTVMVGEDSTGTAIESVQTGKDGVFSMKFLEDVTIVSSYASTSEIMSLEDAINTVTKMTEENKVYEVVDGDTISGIAKKFNLTMEELYAMNEYLEDEDFIHVGDQIVVTVPTPEVSVVVDEQQSYTEDYNKPITYVYNDDKYTTYSKTLEEAVAGVRDVVAIVTYNNGVEANREIIKETIIKEAKAAVVEVGTKTPPTYIKPISGGRITSRFGWRTIFGEKDFHKGIDWKCPIGTTVRASSAGKVIKAGWGGSYGYFILIQHPDGKQTRYAHLSKILVKKGEYVEQNEKIGKTGNTGRSTGPHIHFEVIVNGEPANPLKYIG